MQEAGEIIRAVRQQFPASKPDKKIEKLPLDQIRIGTAGSIRKRRVGDSKWTCIAPQGGDTIEQLLVWSPRQERREQRIFLGPRGIDLVQIDDSRVSTVGCTGCLFEARLSHLTLRRCRRPRCLSLIDQRLRPRARRVNRKRRSLWPRQGATVTALHACLRLLLGRLILHRSISLAGVSHVVAVIWFAGFVHIGFAWRFVFAAHSSRP